MIFDFVYLSLVTLYAFARSSGYSLWPTKEAGVNFGWLCLVAKVSIRKKNLGLL